MAALLSIVLSALSSFTSHAPGAVATPDTGNTPSIGIYAGIS